ncbi:L-threonylcarbamoyladenylate synthase [Verrucomicrobia bacterium]|nr:L-threonylcarbamoyladenylate synthase [Verrucomicrobiota bacterium]
MPILSTDTPEAFEAACTKASQLITSGGVVALPSETVYGLAADATQESAVESIYTTKGRPSHNPLIIHVADESMALEYVSAWPESAEKLAKAFWPGPLTLVLPHKNNVSKLVTAGGETVALRLPAHPVFREVIRKVGKAIAAPSANRSNHISPTLAVHVSASLGENVIVLDGGPCPVGIESTVVDLTTSPATVLRPGSVSAEALASILGDCRTNPGKGNDILKSPGQLSRHYAPKSPLVLFEPIQDDISDLLAANDSKRSETIILGHTIVNVPESAIPDRLLPAHPSDYARCLYAELYQCDQTPCHLILVQKPPPTNAWTAIHDRLQRASKG